MGLGWRPGAHFRGVSATPPTTRQAVIRRGVNTLHEERRATRTAGSATHGLRGFRLRSRIYCPAPKGDAGTGHHSAAWELPGLGGRVVCSWTLCCRGQHRAPKWIAALRALQVLSAGSHTDKGMGQSSSGAGDSRKVMRSRLSIQAAVAAEGGFSSALNRPEGRSQRFAVTGRDREWQPPTVGTHPWSLPADHRTARGVRLAQHRLGRCRLPGAPRRLNPGNYA